MTNVIAHCQICRTGKDWCKLSSECLGWGCRHILVIPNKVPTTELERAKLFSKVYKLIERTGIKDCPFFDETYIDQVLESPTKISEIIAASLHFQTVLLSEPNDTPTNNPINQQIK